MALPINFLAPMYLPSTLTTLSTTVSFTCNFGSDVLDLNNVGTRSLYFNTLSTLLYENNYVKYYRSQFGGFGYQRELANGILWMGGLNYSSRTQMYNNAFGHIFDVKTRSTPLTTH
jgi:hypothetical protein